MGFRKTAWLSLRDLSRSLVDTCPPTLSPSVFQKFLSGVISQVGGRRLKVVGIPTPFTTLATMFCLFVCLTDWLVGRLVCLELAVLLLQPLDAGNVAVCHHAHRPESRHCLSVFL